MQEAIFTDPAVLAEICTRHHIRRLSLFGSRLKGTARPGSDIDLLVEFEPGHEPGLLRLGQIQADLAAVLRERQRIDLRTSADLSRQVVDEDEAESIAEPADNPRVMRRDPRLVVSALARSVRQTLAMEAKVTEREHGRAGYNRDQQAALADEEETARREAWYNDRRATVIDLVTPLIEAEAENERNEADLYRWLDELVDDEDIESGFATRPIGEIVARFCRELELTPDRDSWRSQPWAIEEAESKAPGSPYADGWCEEAEAEIGVAADGTGPPAKSRGLWSADRFGYNLKGGWCEACQGGAPDARHAFVTAS